MPVQLDGAQVPGNLLELVELDPLHQGLTWCLPCLSLDSGSSDPSVLVTRQVGKSRSLPCRGQINSPVVGRQAHVPIRCPGKPWLLLPSGGGLWQCKRGGFHNIVGNGAHSILGSEGPIQPARSTEGKTEI